MPRGAPLPMNDRALVAKFTTIGLWAVLFAVFLPEAYRGVLAEALVLALTGLTVLGAALAITGLLRRSNLVTEVTGLCLMLAGPVSWLVLVVVVGFVAAFTGGGTDRIAVMLVALLQVEVIASRLLFLLSRRHDVTHEAVER